MEQGEQEEDDSSSESEAEESNKRRVKQMFEEPSDEEEESEDDEAAGFREKGVESDEEEEDEEEDEEVHRTMEAFELPGAGEDDDDEDDTDPATVGKRIKELLGFLNNFRKQAKKGQSRSDFVDQLVKDCSRYYGYLPSLIELFLNLFSPDEMVEFLEANETPRPVVIRTNTLKARRRELAKALATRGVSLEPLADWSNVGLKVYESTVPIGATPEYLAGHYMLQSASSFAPVLALAPGPKERVLDMASAPGGKTSYLAQMMKNTGLIVANDFNKDRINATVSNLARLGVRNTIHCCHDGREFPKVVGGFDRVLLDAPCSGLGVIQRDPSVKLSRTTDDIRTTAKLQKQLLLAAIDSVDHRSKKGGYIVYSTCSIAAEENEMVVQYALEKRDVEIVDSELEFGRPGLTRYVQNRFHPSMKHAKRLYPHVHNMDGFFLVKLKKLSNKGSPTEVVATPDETSEKSKKKKVEKNADSQSKDNKFKKKTDGKSNDRKKEKGKTQSNAKSGDKKPKKAEIAKSTKKIVEKKTESKKTDNKKSTKGMEKSKKEGKKVDGEAKKRKLDDKEKKKKVKKSKK
uniref:SAM-dependent MTase RsmB/NOP-type domain-containing protein n=1 Tax=Mucochytrium quahogii TaxID=96639 RepID=A0A7S2S5E3_9STRA